jgi:SAM-dependent methyltransferase
MSESTGFYNTIARYYDAENTEMTDDLMLYAEIADESGDPILDVGCGTGRVMLHLAQSGYRVIGVDTSREMLERGRRKLKVRMDLQDRVQFIEGDALTQTYPERFSLIAVPYNGLMHLGTAERQLSLIQHLSTQLKDDGLLVIDLPNAGEAFGTVDDGAVTLERSFIEPESGNMVMQQSVSRIDRTAQLQYISWIYDEIGKDGTVRRTVAPLVLRYIFPTELDLMLRISGLKRVSRYGEYDQSPFEAECSRLIVVAARA